MTGSDHRNKLLPAGGFAMKYLSTLATKIFIHQNFLIEHLNSIRAQISVLVLLGLVFSAKAQWLVAVGGNSSRNGNVGAISAPVDTSRLWTSTTLPTQVATQAVISNEVVLVNRIPNLSNPLTGAYIAALSLQTGDTLWTKILPVDSSSNWFSRISAVNDNVVYATRSGNDQSAYLYALDLLTGEQLWRSEFRIRETAQEGAVFAPNGDLVVGSLDHIARIRATDGIQLWRTDRYSPTSDGSLAVVHDGRVFSWEAGPYGPTVMVLDLETGSHLYSSRGIGGGFVQQSGLFIGPDGTVYAPRNQNNALSDTLVAFTPTPAGFEEKWSSPIGYAPFGSYAVDDSTVYAYNSLHQIIRLRASDGSLLKTSMEIPTDFFQPRIAVAAGLVFLTNGGFSQGSVYAFTADLDFVWSEPVPSVNLGGPAFATDGTMIICGTSQIRAYRAAPNTIADKITPVTIFHLEQNYPNPFNPETVISWQLASGNLVHLKIYDAIGREVQTLVNDMMPAGNHKVVFNAAGLPSGVYFYRLEAGGQVQTRQMLLLR